MTEKERENSNRIQGCCNSNFILKLESYCKFDLSFLAWTEEKCRYGCVNASEECKQKVKMQWFVFHTLFMNLESWAGLLWFGIVQ